MKSFFTYIAFGLFLVSCDCYKVATGKVVDKTTQKPISGVKVCLSDQPSTFSYTDSTGSYEIYYIKTGLSCYTKVKKKVIAEKKGYKKSTEMSTQNSIELITDSLKTKPL